MCCHLATANPDAKRLYDDLLKKKKYNPLMRPVEDHTHNLTVKIDLKLSQLIDVVSNLRHLAIFEIYTLATFHLPSRRHTG